jgi:hypothetical protein
LCPNPIRQRDGVGGRKEKEGASRGFPKHRKRLVVFRAADDFPCVIKARNGQMACIAGFLVFNAMGDEDESRSDGQRHEAFADT